MSRDFIQLHEDWMIAEALKAVWEYGAPQHIHYLYITDSDGRGLGGVADANAFSDENFKLNESTSPLTRRLFRWVYRAAAL